MKPPRSILVLSAGVLGMLCFIWIFGMGVLDVRQTGWMIHGDSAQHQLGWAFFRTTEWQWPLGTISNFGYPFKTTLAFTDSIPLLALPLKLISSGLPADFNYFGWWMAACLTANAMAAASILQRSGLTPAAVLGGAVLFAFTPCMMLRAYGHESLMAHALILLALSLALQTEQAAPFRRVAWLMLLAACVLVHPYFWVMVLALYAGALAQAVRHPQALRPIQALAWLLAGLGLSALALWSLGYLDGQGKTFSAIGYPNYSANLLTWLDPMDWHWFLSQYQRSTDGTAQWSRWLPSLGQADRDQYEGFAYMGAGILLLLARALWATLRRRAPTDATAGGTRAHMRLWGWPVWAVLTLMAVYALSTKLTVGVWVVTDLALSPSMHKWLSIYRACGRFVWPLTYALMLWSLVQLARLQPLRQSVWVLLALALQLSDLAPKMGEFHRMFTPVRSYATPLDDPVWNRAVAQASHLVVLEDTSKSEDWVAFSHLAARHGVTSSTGLLSRVDEGQQAAWMQAQKAAVSAGQPAAGHVYVSREKLPTPQGWTQTQANGWWLLFRQE